jgi:hypothetical protein
MMAKEPVAETGKESDQAALPAAIEIDPEALVTSMKVQVAEALRLREPEPVEGVEI